MSSYRAFAGDWHGNIAWTRHVLDTLAAAHITTIYHVGDFGLWPGSSGKRFLIDTQRALDERGMTVTVVPGNHEDYNRIDQMKFDSDGWQILKDYPAIRFAPRGHIWEDDGIRFAALGGAGSIDIRFRARHTSWWPQEEITDTDVSALVTNVTAAGWDRVDILLTHEAPAGLRRVGLQPRPGWITPEIEHYCYTQRVRLRDGVDQVAPAYLFHGHWHEWHRDHIDGVRPDGSDYHTEVFSLEADGSNRNIVTAALTPGRVLTDFAMPLSAGRQPSLHP